MMVNILLAVGTTVLLLGSPEPDMSSFRLKLEESRLSAVRAYAQFIKGFNDLSQDQKEFLITKINGKPFAAAIDEFPEIIMAIDSSITALGGKSLTKKEFNRLIEEELAK